MGKYERWVSRSIGPVGGEARARRGERVEASARAPPRISIEKKGTRDCSIVQSGEVPPSTACGKEGGLEEVVDWVEEQRRDGRYMGDTWRLQGDTGDFFVRVTLSARVCSAAMRET